MKTEGREYVVPGRLVFSSRVAKANEKPWPW